MILAANHASNLDAGGPRRVADPDARPADPLARQEGAVRLADRRLGGAQRRRPPGRPRRGRRRGVPAGPADPRRGQHPVRLPRGHAQPRRRAPGGPGRPGGARAAHRRADRADRDRRLERRLAAGPEAAASRRPRHGPRRAPVPARRRAAAGHGPASGQGPRDGHDHAADRGAPARAPARRLRRLADAPEPSPAPPDGGV